MRSRHLCGKILHHALTSVQLAMQSYAPDGGWGEGPGYWAYATSYNVTMLACLESATGSDFGLSKFPGFDQTALFPLYMTGGGQSLLQFRRLLRACRPRRLPAVAGPPLPTAGRHVVRGRHRAAHRRGDDLVSIAGQRSGRGRLAVGQVLAERRSGHAAKPLERSAGAVRRHPGPLAHVQSPASRHRLVRARCPGPALGRRSGGRQLQPARLLRRAALRLLSPAGRGAQHAGDRPGGRPRPGPAGGLRDPPFRFETRAGLRHRRPDRAPMASGRRRSSAAWPWSIAAM